MNRMQGSIRRKPSFNLNFAGLRRFPRSTFQVEVLVQDRNGWEIPLESVDFSAAGMFVESHFLFDVGTVHNLIFRTPDGTQLFSVRAQVVRVESDEPPEKDDKTADVRPGMAYEFIETNAETCERLQELAARV